jgi:hypothetical protein
MASLGEVYHGGDRNGPGRKRVYAGASLFLVGVVLVVAGIVVATTDVLIGGGTTLTDVREYGGILAGLGVPAVFLGLSTVLPAKLPTRAAAGIGASIAVLGVALFAHAYPCRWSGANCGPGMADLTLPTVGVYFLGAVVTFWCLFMGIANFKTRNDPGGTVTMDVTREGDTKVIEVDRAGRSVNAATTASASVSDGGDDDTDIREVGGTPDDGGGWGARANRGQSGNGGGTATASGGGAGAGTGGSVPKVGESPRVGESAGGGSSTGGADGGVDDETWKSTAATGATTDAADRYCGNCEHFEYVRTERGIQPYCGFHEGVMADMDPCDDWSDR